MARKKLKRSLKKARKFLDSEVGEALLAIATGILTQIVTDAIEKAADRASKRRKSRLRR